MFVMPNKVVHEDEGSHTEKKRNFHFICSVRTNADPGRPKKRRVNESLSDVAS